MKQHSLRVLCAAIVCLVAGSVALAAHNLPSDIEAAAQKSVGKKMWFGYGLAKGTLGCAAALSNVLKQAGVSSAHSATVTVVRRQLLASGLAQELKLRSGEGTQIDDATMKQIAHPGDVVLAFKLPPDKNYNGGADAHCGILADGGDIYTNDWMDGIWKKVNIHLMFDYYPYVRLLRLTDKAQSE